MERTHEEFMNQQYYMIAMHYMIQMQKEGILDLEDLVEAEKIIKDRYHPYWHYMWFDFEEK